MSRRTKSPPLLPRRLTFRSIDNTTAADLIAAYSGLVHTIAADHTKGAYGCGIDDLISVGYIAVLEGHITYCHGVYADWLKRVIRWRIKLEASRHIERPANYDDIASALVDTDPEELYATAFAREAIGKLDPRRGVLLQARLQGYTCMEVAEQLGISPQRVNKLEHEAYEQLKLLLDDEIE